MRISDWSSDVCSSDLCAKSGAGHVFLRIPDIALRAQIRDTEIAAEHFRCHPFNELVERRSRQRHIERQEVTPETTCVGHAQENLAQRIGEQEDVAEMDDAVEVVAQNGRASCRERVLQYVQITVVAVSLQTNKLNTEK